MSCPPPRSPSSPPPLPSPDGGFLAYLQVFLAFLAILNTWGLVNSFGAFQTYYSTFLPQNSASSISWIGSIQAFLMFSVGTLSGPLLDAGHFRLTILVGAVLQVVGIFTMSVSTTYWQLLLTQGICTGLGGGIFFVPVMGLVSTYFERKRGLALGIVTTGTSAGGLIYPVVVQQLIDKVGFGWTVRVLGFMNLASLTAVVAGMRPRLQPTPRGPVLDIHAFRDIPYTLHALGLCLLMPPVYFVFYYIASYAHDTLHIPYTTSLNLVILLNSTGIPFRILPGLLADLYTGPLNMFALTLLINIAILWCWLAVTSIPGYYAWTVMYGISAATFQSMFSTTIAAYCDDLGKIGARLGMAFMGMGVATLVGGPVSGKMVKVGGGYVLPICWNGGLMVMGTALVVAARVWKYGWSCRVRC